MIFVTVGSQKFPFDRLIRQLDELVADGSIPEDEIYAQYGASTYEPVHMKGERFMDRESFAHRIEQCDMLITHGGEGTVMSGIAAGKKVVAVPRYGKYGEHLNDHQLMIVRAMEKLGHIVAVYDTDNLKEKIELARKTTFVPYESQKNQIIETLRRFIG